jgi:hypothetical protein
MENCFVLYSCDGSYAPIISNNTDLSAYTNSFVSIIITAPYIVPSTCFYVLSLGVIDCDVTYDIIVDPDIPCDCGTLCYFVDIEGEYYDTIYVRNNNEIVVDQFQTGITANFCSKIYPVFDYTGTTKVKIMGTCVGDVCPPTIPSVKRTNECDVTTIFPMYVECLTQAPTNQYTFDGSVQLLVTGGTPPYTIFWEIGSYAPALTNLGAGDYNAQITDYYGDFVINTTCVLTAETVTYSAMCFVLESKTSTQYLTIQPSGVKNSKPYYVISNGLISVGIVFWDGQTNTWVFCQTFDCNPNQLYAYLDNNDGPYPTTDTLLMYEWEDGTNLNYTFSESYVGPCSLPIIPKTYPNLCLFLLVRSSGEDPVEQIQIDLGYNSIVNGQPSWESSDNQYYLYWNTGATPNQWVITGYSNNSQIVNYNAAEPPISNWQNFGDATLYTVSVLSGSCSADSLVGFNAVVNDAVCDNSGTIMITAYGGTPPYQYSINYGQTYQNSPYFQNLAPGNYGVRVIDSNGVTEQNLISVLSTPPVTYQLGFAYTIGGAFQINAPTLPAGITITFDLVHTGVLTYYPNTLIVQPTYNNFTTITGVGLMTPYNNLNSFSFVSGPCSLTSPIYKNQEYRVYKNTLTIGSNGVISGSTTNTIINAPSGPCTFAGGTYTLQLANLRVNGCDCCSVEVIGF